MKSIKDISETCLIEQYKELRQASRYYDHQFWIIPGLNYTIIGILYGAILDPMVNNLPITRLVLWIIPVISLGFLIQMINERVYHAKNKLMLDPIVKSLKLDRIESKRLEGWKACWIQCIRAPFVLTVIMFILLIAQIAIALLV